MQVEVKQRTKEIETDYWICESKNEGKKDENKIILRY